MCAQRPQGRWSRTIAVSASVINWLIANASAVACTRRPKHAHSTGTPPSSVPRPPIPAKSAVNCDWWQVGKNSTLLKYAGTLLAWSADLHPQARPSRRDRRRQETITDIKTAARAQLAEGAPTGISLQTDPPSAPARRPVRPADGSRLGFPECAATSLVTQQATSPARLVVTEQVVVEQVIHRALHPCGCPQPTTAAARPRRGDNREGGRIAHRTRFPLVRRHRTRSGAGKPVSGL
jgi:hypothetical protein